MLAGGWLGWQAGLPDCLLAPERFILHKKEEKKKNGLFYINGDFLHVFLIFRSFKAPKVKKHTRKITIYVKSIVSAYMERSAHAWGAAQPQHICALRAAAQRTALRTKLELQTAHAVPAVCSALYAARAAPHACCAPYLRSYIPCVLRCMYATRHNVLNAPAGPQRSAAQP